MAIAPLHATVTQAFAMPHVWFTEHCNSISNEWAGLKPVLIEHGDTCQRKYFLWFL